MLSALEFLNRSYFPAFAHCETINFIRIVDRSFDYLNSRDLLQKHFKEPIRNSSLDFNKQFLSASYKYFRKQKVGGVGSLEHAWKTFAFDFLTNVNFMNILSEALLNELEFKYTLTYKFSQDHIELLFSGIRQRG